MTIREFLCLLNGNELVIALILFNWLFIGALWAPFWPGHSEEGPRCGNSGPPL
ncbi:MAG: hypothetical protein R2860_15260 [Desulfobacterales bacterium]